MADANVGQGNEGAADQGAGNAGAGAGGAGDAGAGGAGGNGAAGNPAPWHGLTAAEDISYIENKGWQNFGDALRSYRGAEKHIGRDPETIVAIPRPDDPDGFRAVAAKLGMPDSPDGYEFKAPEGLEVNEAYLGWAKDAFHKAGLTANQAKQIYDAHNEFARQTFGKEQEDYQLNVEADTKALQSEWKGGFERMMNAAKTAARGLELPAEAIDAMEEKLGYAGVMKMMAKIGMKMSESRFAGGDGGGEGNAFSETLTPAEAQKSWDKLKADDNFRAMLFDSNHPGHKDAVEKQRKLFSIIHG